MIEITPLAKGQNIDTARLTRTEKQFLNLPSFSMYKDNYFISGTALNHPPSNVNSDVKFQISFRQLLYRKPLVFKSFLYLSYTQKAFWDVYKESKAFADINFNPAIGLMRPYKNRFGMNFLTFSLEHESNGKDSIQSRSWNRIAFGWHTFMSRKLELSLNVWIPFVDKVGNPDLLKYVGYGQLGFNYVIKEDKLFADLVIRKGDQWNWKGSVQTQVSYKLFQRSNEFLMLQWFNGYSENLVNYQNYTNMLRVGLLLRPNNKSFF